MDLDGVCQCCSMVNDIFDVRDYLRDGTLRYPYWIEKTIESYSWRLSLSCMKSMAVDKGEVLEDDELYSLILSF